MYVPIPDDWNGVDWRCVQIQWPDSESWRQILLGLITQPTRGRFWERSTGNIKDTQLIGVDIFDRNYPWRECDVCPDNDGDSGTGCGGSIEIIESEEIMPSITWLSVDELGDLYMHFGPCCKIKVESDVVESLGTDPYADDDTVTYSSCGKADALVDALWLVLDEGWDSQSANPLNWVGNVENALPGYDLSDNAIWALVQQAHDLDNDYSKSEVLTDFRKQQLKCLAAGVFSELAGGINQLEYNQWQALANVVFEGEQRQFAITGMQAIGQGNSSKIAALGAVSVTADCTCPEQPTGETLPTASGWYFSAPHIQRISAPGGFNDAVAVFFETLVHDAFGIAWQGVEVSGFPLLRVKPSNDSAPQQGFDHWWFGSNSNSDGPDTWQVQCGNGAWAEIEAAALLPGMSHYLQFLWSDTPATPGADKDELSLAKINARADGGDTDYAVVDIAIRYLYNTNSPSHS